MGSAPMHRARDAETVPSQPVLDAAYLRRCTFGDAVLREEILGLFFAQVDGMARSLALPQTEGSWHYLTHTLKGAAAAIGASALAQLAEAWGHERPPVQALARDGKARALANALSDLRAVCSTLAN